MEFDLSKENIQPLRGGRNVTQLGVALQAQNDSDFQRELMQQKGAFEEAIRTYDGNEPLDNWYNYIYWVEQSYPKHGHEGNLIPLLEDCLSKFENDERYIHDRRLCKLWIKYIDLQQNPLELFQLLYSKGICVSCADLYRAWAFHHEIAGDYKKADAVFQIGLRAFAQPFEELNYAHQNMFMAIGRQAIQGVDERRREEERHALTSLVSYNQNQRTVVPSIRIGNNILNSTPGILPNSARQGRNNSNASITLYEDLEVAGPSIGACASVSILEAARKQEVVHKENSLKPGTWKKGIITKKVPQPRQPAFKVHEDEDPAFAGGIRLPPDFAPMNFDDFSTWQTDLFYPDPEDDTKIPMYPKHLVYGTPDVEFSPEEIHARKWFAKKQAETETEAKNDTCMTMQETVMEEANIHPGNSQHHPIHSEIEQAVQSILPSTSEATNNHNVNLSQNESLALPNLSFLPQNISAYEHDTSSKQLQSFPGQSALQPKVYQNVTQDVSNHMPSQYVSELHTSHYHDQVPRASVDNSKLEQASSSSLQMQAGHQPQPWTGHNSARRITQNKEVLVPVDPIQQWPNNTVNSDENYTQNMREAMKSINEIWKDSLTHIAEPTIHIPVQKPEIGKFQVYEDTVLTESDRQKQEARAVESISSNSKLQFNIYDESENVNKRVPQQNLGSDVNLTRGHKKPARENIPHTSHYHEQLPHTSPDISKLPQASTSQLVNSSMHMYSGHQPQSWTENNITKRITQNREVLVPVEPVQQWPNNIVHSDENYTQNMISINEIWKDRSTHIPESTLHIPMQKPEMNKFHILEDVVLTKADSQRQEARAVGPKSSNSKSQFNIYHESENDNKRVPQPNLGLDGNPTMGYRKPMREYAPFSSQPLSEPDHELPRKTPSYSEPICAEKFVRSAEGHKPGGFTIFEDNASGIVASNMNDSCTTQQFNFNLKSGQVSTPFNKKKMTAEPYANATVFNQIETLEKHNKKLFEENETQQEIVNQDVLSVILETTKEYRNSSSSRSSSNSTGACTLKTLYRESLKVIPEISRIYDDSVHEVHSKVREQAELDNLDINNYSMIKNVLKSDSPVDKRKSYLASVSKSPMKDFIDLTGDDSIVPKQNFYRFSEIGGGDAIQNQQKLQKPPMNNYESPMKNQFREMTCDSSNDSLTSSPVKGLKMDVDLNLSRNSNSEFIMEHESEEFDETILQKPPSNPFNNKVNAALLRKVGFPNPKYSREYVEMQSLPRLVAKKDVTFVDDTYMIEKIIGKGAFGCVYKATNMKTAQMVALKFQKPANKWEYYIIKEIKERCNPYMITAFMDVTACYISKSVSVLVSEFIKFGSLLDLTNKVKKLTGKGLKELVSIYYAREIITIVNTLHKCEIIHADIKPDNFLVTHMPPDFGYPSLKLIDFGSSIDMTLFPKGIYFKTAVNTENFICTEMKDGRPWTYQTDIFCIAATVHVLLFDKYMQVQKCGKIWTIIQHIPRYLRQDLWKIFFHQMLNIEGCDQLPDLDQVKSSFDSILSMHSEELQMEMRLVANLGK